MALTKNTILSHKEIEHKIKRIAYQIYESNVNETELIIAGIESNGYLLAKKIKSNLYSIDNIQEALNFERDSFFTKYSWTVIPSFFHIDTIRKDYLSKSTERCKIIWDEIYNS